MDKQVIKEIIKFRDKRGFEKYHKGEHLAKALIIEASELLECFQWQNEASDVKHLKEELADVFIYATLLAEKYNFDIKEIILDKLEKNKIKYPINNS